MSKGLIKQATEKARLKNIVGTASPAVLVDKILNLTNGKKAKDTLTKKFKELTGISQKEITYARNRHPYYKKLKNKGIRERLEKRNSLNRGKKIKWDIVKLKQFVELDSKHTAPEMAILFDCSVPSINSIRRKLSMLKNAGIKEKKYYEYLAMGENQLRNYIKTR